MPKKKAAKRKRLLRGKPHAEPLPPVETKLGRAMKQIGPILRDTLGSKGNPFQGPDFSGAAQIITTPVIEGPPVVRVPWVSTAADLKRIPDEQDERAALIKPTRRNQPVAREEAERRTDEIKASAHSLAGAYLRVGMEVKACLDDRVPEALEMTAHEWMKECFAESVAKIYRAVRIVKSLKALPPARLAELTEGNAYELSRLPEVLRADPEWVARAEREPNAEFKAAVDAALAEKGVPPEEQRVRLVLSLPFSLANVVNDALSKAARILELDLETRPGQRVTALEHICANYLAADEETLKAEMEG